MIRHPCGLDFSPAPAVRSRKWGAQPGVQELTSPQVPVASLTAWPAPRDSRHNDLPWQLLSMFNNRLQDTRANLTTLANTHTNIPKLRAGFVGGQVPPALPSLTLRGVIPSPTLGLATVWPSLWRCSSRVPQCHRPL